jgi:anionic cell wall polymer biosynthesis LytR-Cps2A-Psr (LCP) family protein
MRIVIYADTMKISHHIKGILLEVKNKLYKEDNLDLTKMIICSSYDSINDFQEVIDLVSDNKETVFILHGNIVEINQKLIKMDYKTIPLIVDGKKFNIANSFYVLSLRKHKDRIFNYIYNCLKELIQGGHNAYKIS